LATTVLILVCKTTQKYIEKNKRPIKFDSNPETSKDT